MKTQTIDRLAMRHAPWGGAKGDMDLVILGKDWSGAAYTLQVRAARGDTGTPLVALINAAAGSQGVNAAYDAGYLHPVTGLAVGATRIRPQIDQATLEAIPFAADDPSAILELHYDLRVAPVGALAFILVAGRFHLNPGVTI